MPIMDGVDDGHWNVVNVPTRKVPVQGRGKCPVCCLQTHEMADLAPPGLAVSQLLKLKARGLITSRDFLDCVIK